LAEIGVGRRRPLLHILFYTFILVALYISTNWTYSELFSLVDDILFEFRWAPDVSGGLRGWIKREFSAILGWLGYHLVQVVVFFYTIFALTAVGVCALLYTLLHLVFLLIRGIYRAIIWLVRPE
jgi:hypothetical protein